MDYQLNEVESKIINDLVNADTNEEVKELAVCKAKLVVAEQKVIVLEAQLKDVTRQLEDENSRTMLTYLQMNEITNKLKSAEFQRLQEEAMESEAKAKLPASRKPYEIQDHTNRHAKPSLFTAKLLEDDDDVFKSCFRLDDDNSCTML